MLLPSGSAGHGKWVLRFTRPITGKRRNAGLGSYPEISTADAAKQASLMREQIAKGIDPLEEKARKLGKPDIPNFQQAAELLHAELMPSWRNAKHGKYWLSSLRQYAFPFIGSLYLEQIEPRHIADVLRPVWLEHLNQHVALSSV